MINDEKYNICVIFHVKAEMCFYSTVSKSCPSDYIYLRAHSLF